MAAPRKYSVELKERATRMAVEARRDPATRPSLEAADSLAVIGVMPLVKTLALDLTTLDDKPSEECGIFGVYSTGEDAARLPRK